MPHSQLGLDNTFNFHLVNIYLFSFAVSANRVTVNYVLGRFFRAKVGFEQLSGSSS